MSKDLELFESTPISLGKRKEIDPAEDQEEAIGGQSQKKAAIGGDCKEEDEKGGGCEICSSETHTCRICPWNVRIPPEIDYVPKVGRYWMVFCKNWRCRKQRFHTEPNKCSCGYDGKYVLEKKCVACMQGGHLNNKDKDCEFFGMTGEQDPFYKLVKKMIKHLGLDPGIYLEAP